MHLSSLDKMKLFRRNYLSGKENTRLKIIDLGSMEIGGTYRPIFDEEKWKYTGLDLMPGKNVDIVLSDPYNWLEIESDSADVFISGQTFEHIEYFWKTMLEIARVMKPGALCCIVAPSSGPEHKYPLDCWRFYPDGFKALARYTKLEVLEANTQWNPAGYSDGSDMWADTVLVAKKPNLKQSNNQKHLYQRTVTEDSDDSLGKLVKHIKPDTTVMELGPATGYLTEYMQKQLNCKVDCVEISPEMAKTAEKFCRHMLVADLDKTDLEEKFNKNTYDCIILADVLEHLRENEKTLRACRNLLKNDGKLILSIPNIAHASIIGSLLKGRFEYTQEGLLDTTHVRFYTKKSILDLLNQLDFSIETIETIQKLPEETEIGDSLTDLPGDLQKMIFDREDSLTYQFVIVCRPGLENFPDCKADHITPVSAADLRKSHLMSLNERISELDKALLHAQNLAAERMDNAAELEKALSHTQDLFSESFEKNRELEKGLLNAQEIAYERLTVINKLDKGLAHAQELVCERSDNIKEFENALSHAQQLAYERLDRINEFENALSHAQQLAYERLDKINELEQAVAEQSDSKEYYKAMLEEKEIMLQQMLEHPGYKLYEKIRGLVG
ncbi:MAG: methyltransferase domain-containing protein [Desulfobacteraceae bacterium]|nr:methyltransferase domain-containing protein [Desulfobacteraceae bacterium]